MLQTREEAESTIRGVVHGESSHGAGPSEHRKLVLEWIKKIRLGFAGSVIRRTHKSVDNLGHQLFGLPPLHENQMVLELYPYEYDNLADIAEGMMGKDSAKGTRFAEGNVSNMSISHCPSRVCVARPGRSRSVPDSHMCMRGSTAHTRRVSSHTLCIQDARCWLSSLVVTWAVAQAAAVHTARVLDAQSGREVAQSFPRHGSLRPRHA